MKTHDEIITKFLSYRLARFVRQVYLETIDYMVCPRVPARKGYLKRDRVAFKLINRAYNRYLKINE